MTPTEKVNLAMNHLVANVEDAPGTAALSGLNIAQANLGGTRVAAARMGNRAAQEKPTNLAL